MVRSEGNIAPSQIQSKLHCVSRLVFVALYSTTWGLHIPLGQVWVSLSLSVSIDIPPPIYLYPLIFIDYSPLGLVSPSRFSVRSLRTVWSLTHQRDFHSFVHVVVRQRPVIGGGETRKGRRGGVITHIFIDSSWNESIFPLARPLIFASKRAFFAGTEEDSLHLDHLRN